jgi:hypothetical protein
MPSCGSHQQRRAVVLCGLWHDGVSFLIGPERFRLVTWNEPYKILYQRSVKTVIPEMTDNLLL